ncbi:glycosyltransferase family 2 protein [bacterium]|nr:glycosyltransferase family 2 protein [bacterium]MBU1959029.1 glycosyltransferase family 2 protein [bacterium]
MIKISAAIITYNEEKNIKRCMDSLDFVDEIVIVDSLSSDNTCAIARELGAKVIDQKFLGHINQKQLAVDHCTHDWVLSLDADEEVSEELRTSILELIKNPLAYEAYEMKRVSFHLGKWIRHGGWYPDKKIRFFNKQHAHWGGYNPHDKVIVDGKVGMLEGDLKHYVFKDLRHNIDTNNSYSSIMAEDLNNNGKKFSYFKLFLKPVGKFLEVYLYKKGFLDGMPGFIIAVGAAYSMFLKFAKLWELQNVDKTGSN